MQTNTRVLGWQGTQDGELCPKSRPFNSTFIITTVCASVLDAPRRCQDKTESGPTRSSESNKRNGAIPRRQIIRQKAIKDTQKGPASSTEVYRRKRSNSPKGIKENYVEKGSAQTRRWEWSPQVEMETHVLRVGNSRREGTKTGRCVSGMESSVTGTRALAEGKLPVEGLGRRGSIFTDMRVSFLS